MGAGASAVAVHGENTGTILFEQCLFGISWKRVKEAVGIPVIRQQRVFTGKDGTVRMMEGRQDATLSW